MTNHECALRLINMCADHIIGRATHFNALDFESLKLATKFLCDNCFMPCPLCAEKLNANYDDRPFSIGKCSKCEYDADIRQKRLAEVLSNDPLPKSPLPLARITPGLLILDVDGVLTDGTKGYGPDGSTIMKRFCDHDFTAIKKFQSLGWKVCWLSADTVVNARLALDRRIDFWCSRSPNGSIDKVSWLNRLADHYLVGIPKVVYMGDDLFDIPICDAVVAGGGLAFCPANAVKQLDGHAKRLSTKGGYGAVMELYTMCSDEVTQPCV